LLVKFGKNTKNPSFISKKLYYYENEF